MGKDCNLLQAEISDLQALRDSRGWQLVCDVIRGQLDACLEELANPAYTEEMGAVRRLQGQIGELGRVIGLPKSLIVQKRRQIEHS